MSCSRTLGLLVLRRLPGFGIRRSTPSDLEGRMKYRLGSFLGIGLLLSGVLPQDKARPAVVSKGEYSLLTKNSRGEGKTTIIDRWHMEPLQDGSLSVDVELATTIEGLKAEEHHILTKALKPKHFVSIMTTGV